MSTGKKWEGREVSAFSDLKVEMTGIVWDYLMGWCKAATSEVSGMMIVEYDAKDKVLRVPQIYLPKQECDSASTEIDDDALAALQMRLHKEKVNLKSLRGWWHTHYNFSTFWSATDTGTIEKLMAGNDWFLSIVVNQAEDFKARLDIAAPFPITIDDMDIVVVGQTEDLSKYKADIEAQVTKKVYVPTHHNVGYVGHEWGGNEWKGYDPRFRYWSQGIGYHDGKGNTRADFEKKTVATTEYDGRWWKKWDPELWHGFKAGKAVETSGNGATLKSQTVGQSREDYLKELEADRKAQEAEAASLIGFDDDPMNWRID